jgi:hypothetical protein
MAGTKAIATGRWCRPPPVAWRRTDRRALSNFQVMSLSPVVAVFAGEFAVPPIGLVGSHLFVDKYVRLEASALGGLVGSGLHHRSVDVGNEHFIGIQLDRNAVPCHRVGWARAG